MPQFQRADDMINLAAQYGITVFLDPIETGGWLSILRYNGTAKAFNYGVYVGNRYKKFPNVVYCHGNDFQSWINTGDDAVCGGSRVTRPTTRSTMPTINPPSQPSSAKPTMMARS